MVNLLYGTMIWLLLWLLSVPVPFFFALVLGIMRFVPFVGVPLGTLGTAAILIVTLNDTTDVLLPITVLILADLFVANFVEPYLYARACNLHPVTVFLSALFWVTLWGPIGFVLSVPLTMLLIMICSSLPDLEPYCMLLTKESEHTLHSYYSERRLKEQRLSELHPAK